MTQRTFVLGLVSASLALGDVEAMMQGDGELIRPVPFTAVRLDDGFWRPRIETNRRVTIPFAFARCEETGRIANFDRAAHPGTGPHQGKRFDDTDVYKTIEGAAYALAAQPDPELERDVATIIARIAKAQEPDGYLYPARTIDPEHPAIGAGSRRWSNLNSSHELYNAGHLIEAAIAWHAATGRRDLLDVAERFADLLLHTFGPDGMHSIPGHQEIELALVKLAHAAGRPEFVTLARFFLDQRGREHVFEAFPADSPFAIYNDREYVQDHLPVLEQRSAVGHAVRAAYMYTGMADVAAATGEGALIQAIDELWNDVVRHKLYLTGGIGARHEGEAFGDAYELPNQEAYAETCAAIGNVFWNQRMFQLHGDARYIDVLERTLYNGFVSGVSLAGDRFFYENPLESKGAYERSPWFQVSCCPGNVARLLPSVPGYVYAMQGDSIFVNLFASGEARIALPAGEVRLSQETNYPWEGRVAITIRSAPDARFALRIRVPGWARGEVLPSDLYAYLGVSNDVPRVTVLEQEMPLTLQRGYVVLERSWRAGDRITLDLPMPARRVVTHENVTANRGKVALQRGPLVYAFEEVDHDGHVLDRVLPDDAVITTEHRGDLLGGTVLLHAHGLTALPYHLWAHRGASEMAVWLRRSP